MMQRMRSVFSLVFAIVLLWNAQLALAEGQWISNEQGGLLWWNNIDSAWSVTWSGERDEEMRLNGQGTVIFYKNGQKMMTFEGTVKQGLADGPGKLMWEDGSVFKGNWVDGVRKGYGAIAWNNKNRYEGNWEDDKMNGQGTYFLANGEVYRGEFKDNLFSGEGTYKFTDGEYYKGHFEKDKFNGYGEKHFWDGSILAGIWENDQFMKFTGSNSDIPLAKVDFWVENEYGVPVACIKVKNVSTKPIDAFKVNIRCYNAYGEGVNMFGSNLFRGIAQRDVIDVGQTMTLRWNLYGFSSTKKISPKIYSVHFTDGTTWTP